MELKEAKEELKQLKEDLHGNGFVYGDFDKVIAIDIVLNYIENESIPKEKVRKKIEECVKRRQELANGHFWESPSNINEDTAIVMAQTLYQELLGE